MKIKSVWRIKTYTNKLDEFVVDVRAGRVPKARAGRPLVEEEELVLSSELPVIALRRLLLQRLPLLELLLVRKRDAVHSLQRLGIRAPFPVGRRVLLTEAQ